MYFENFNIFFFIFISILLFLILALLNIILTPQNIYLEKITSYECGFQSFEYYISNFDVKYYIIAILFLIFDLELIFFIPWLLNLNVAFNFSSFAMLIFFLVLVAGFVYEWKTDALEFLDYEEISIYT